MYTDPEMARALDGMGMAVRSNTTNVPKTMKEVAICVIGAHFRSNVEFWAHSRIALRRRCEAGGSRFDLQLRETLVLG